MKKEKISITNPDELNKHLQYTSPSTWIILGLVLAILISFIVWSCIYKIELKIKGMATVNDNVVTLHVEESSKDKLAVGQKVYISNLKGEITAINDGTPTVTTFDLEDGDYPYQVVIREIKPIDFLINK